MDDTDSHDYGPKVGLNLDEISARTLHAAVLFTLDKWSGQEPIDQECLIDLKYGLQAAVLEFNYLR